MIELGKKYRTRDGREARVYAVDGCGEYPVHGAIKQDADTWSCETWTGHGVYHLANPGTSRDLVEVLPEVTVRRKVYDVFGECRVVGDATSVTGEGFPKTGVTFLGPIDITHNGKEITDVRVVK